MPTHELVLGGHAQPDGELLFLAQDDYDVLSLWCSYWRPPQVRAPLQPADQLRAHQALAFQCRQTPQLHCPAC